MRITNGMTMRTFMSDLSNNLQRLSKFQAQQSTQRRIQRLSDDPVGIISGLQARERLYRIEQFQRNVGDANRWLDSTETSIREMNDVVKRAYELCIDASTDVKSASDRQAIAPEIKALLEHLVSLGNSTCNDEYAFGGFNVTKAPFEESPKGSGNWLYNGVALDSFDQADIDADAAKNTLEFEVGYNQTVSVTATGPQVMVYDSGNPPKDMINLLQKFYNDLMDDTKTGEDVAAYVGEFQNAQNHLNALTADFGGRSNRMEMLETRYGIDELMYTTIKSNVEDVDIAEAILNFEMASAVYNASLAAGAKIIQPTLLDYIR